MLHNKWSNERSWINIKKRIYKNFMNKYSILNRARLSSEDGSQDYLVLQPFSSYFATFCESNKIFSWWSKGAKNVKIRRKYLKLHLHQTKVLFQNDL